MRFLVLVYYYNRSISSTRVHLYHHYHPVYMNTDSDFQLLLFRQVPNGWQNIPSRRVPFLRSSNEDGAVCPIHTTRVNWWLAPKSDTNWILSSFSNANSWNEYDPPGSSPSSCTYKWQRRKIFKIRGGWLWNMQHCFSSCLDKIESPSNDNWRYLIPKNVWNTNLNWLCIMPSFHLYLSKKDTEKPSNWDRCCQDKYNTMFPVFIHHAIIT